MLGLLYWANPNTVTFPVKVPADGNNLIALTAVALKYLPAIIVPNESVVRLVSVWFAKPYTNLYKLDDSGLGKFNVAE